MRANLHDAGRTATSEEPLVLIATAPEPSVAGLLTGLLEGGGYVVVAVQAGPLVLGRAARVHPDAIILHTHLPGLGGVDVCRALRLDPRIAEQVPIFILATDAMSADERATALRAGAWDCLRHPGDLAELLLKLQTYVRAKRTVDFLTGGQAGPGTGFHTRSSLVRRARELGALMSRKHGALACIVFAWEVDPQDPRAAQLVARTARLLKSSERVSDLIGVLGPTQFAVVAPATDQAGALKLVQRRVAAVEEALRDEGGWPRPGATLRVGYDAVANLRYDPIDAADLLARASAALRSGIPEPGYAWVRRFDASTGVAEHHAALVPDRRVGP
jgi:CheY-like chemotaxis protein